MQILNKYEHETHYLIRFWLCNHCSELPLLPLPTFVVRWVPVRRPRRGEAVSCWTAVGRRAVRLCVRGGVSQESAPKSRHVSVSVQRESPDMSTAGQEVQPKHLQVREPEGREAEFI